MLRKATPGRDPFAFSMRGMAAINSYAFVPVIPDDRINSALDARLARQAESHRTPLPLVLRIENTLARFFAPGFCEQN